MKKLSIILLMALTVISCTKKDKKQYSYWTINGEEYATNNVEAGNGRFSAIRSHDKVRFNIVVYSYSFPTSGAFPIVTDSNQGPGVIGVGFDIETIGYLISPNEHTLLLASKKNSKASYYLAPTWFVNNDNPNDSLLIEGTFNQP